MYKYSEYDKKIVIKILQGQYGLIIISFLQIIIIVAVYSAEHYEYWYRLTFWDTMYLVRK